MSVAGAVFITAVGAILRYAVNDSVQGVDVQTVGLILMIAGIVGFVITMFIELSGRRRTDRYVEVREERDPPPPPRY